MNTEHPTTKTTGRTDGLEYYLPVMPSETLIALGRRVATLLNQYE